MATQPSQVSLSSALRGQSREVEMLSPGCLRRGESSGKNKEKRHVVRCVSNNYESPLNIIAASVYLGCPIRPYLAIISQEMCLYQKLVKCQKKRFCIEDAFTEWEWMLLLPKASPLQLFQINSRWERKWIAMKTLDFRIVELHYTKTHEVVHLKSQPQGFLKCNFIVLYP